MTSIILCFNKHQLTQVHLENDRDDNWTIGAISRAKLQSNHHHQQTDIQFFTGWLPFLSPNQQCQSTEGKISHSMDLLTPSSPEGLPTLSPTTNSSWLPWRRVAMPLISPLMPVPQISSRKLKICIYTRRKIRWFPKCYSFRSAMKSNEFIAEKNRFRTVASPGACRRLAVLNWRSLSIRASSFELQRCRKSELQFVIEKKKRCSELSCINSTSVFLSFLWTVLLLLTADL